MSGGIIDRIEVYRASDGWRWRAKARNNETVGTGEAYESKASLLQTVAGTFENIRVVELDEADD